MRKILFTGLFVMSANVVSAQVVVNPTYVLFQSSDHNAIIPAGFTGSGQPFISNYVFELFPNGANPAQTPSIWTSGLIDKNLAATVGTDYRYNNSAIGLVIPACSASPCPQYQLHIMATGVAGDSLKGSGSMSNPFTGAAPAPPRKPAAPSNVREQL